MPGRASCFAQDDFEEQDEFIIFFKSSWCNSSFLSKHPGAIHPIIQIVQSKTANAARYKFSPQTEAMTSTFSSVFILPLRVQVSDRIEVYPKVYSWYAYSQESKAVTGSREDIWHAVVQEFKFSFLQQSAEVWQDMSYLYITKF